MPTPFVVPITDEQLETARRLVDHSLAHHPVGNIWSDDARTSELRMTGTLGEIVVADLYNLPRPTRSYGAVGGQDFGHDLTLNTAEGPLRVDVKSMGRNPGQLRGHYVLNVPSSQLNRPDSQTDAYLHLSLAPKGTPTEATMVGLARADEVRAGRVGELFVTGTVRARADGTTFKFTADTYEIALRDFATAPDPPHPVAGFRRLPPIR